VEDVELTCEEVVWILVVVLDDVVDNVVELSLVLLVELVDTLVVEVDAEMLDVEVIVVEEVVVVEVAVADDDQENVVVLKMTGPYAPQVAFTV